MDTNDQNTKENPENMENTAESEEKTKEPTELEKIKAERDEYLAGWQRAKADFANAKKRMDESMKEYRAMANEGLIEELLPVLQSFEMAFANKEAWEKADKNWRSGIEYIYAQLKGVVEQNGLKEINPIDQTFDPMMHEAVSFEKNGDTSKAGKILKVVEKGYMLGSKLIKPPKVVVSELKEA
jgi:molecular chaperone GrpE